MTRRIEVRFAEGGTRGACSVARIAVTDDLAGERVLFEAVTRPGDTAPRFNPTRFWTAVAAVEELLQTGDWVMSVDGQQSPWSAPAGKRWAGIVRHRASLTLTLTGNSETEASA